mgnify:FL=1|tara:strand:- start:346 stop:594 length:249 start_codon:yes stop_codon:yes gene_type:complete
MSKVFTWNEILRSKNNNLIVANNNVYDISELLEIHPGGKKCLLNNLKTDCTIDYKFHSKKGKSEWYKYKIGYIKKNNSCIIL